MLGAARKAAPACFPGATWELEGGELGAAKPEPEDEGTDAADREHKSEQRADAGVIPVEAARR